MGISDFQTNLENISLGIFLTLFCFGGIIGNIVTTIVLINQEIKRSSTSNIVVNFFLIGLTISDTLFLFTWSNVGIAYLYRFIYGTLPASYFLTKCGAYFSLLIRPVGYIGQVGSTLFTIAVTLDRYIAIIHTFWAMNFWTRQRGLLTTFGIFSVAITCSIPFYFALQVNSIEQGNLTVTAGYVVENNAFGNTSSFANYNLWLFTIINTFIPIPLLLVCNVAIYKKVRESKKLRAKMTRSQVRDISLARILLCIVLIFAICNIPAITRCVLFSLAFQDQQIRLSDAGKVESYISLTILRILDWIGICINSSANFIIYCVMSRSFRKSLMEIIKILISYCKCRCISKINSNQSSRRSSNENDVNSSVIFHVSPNASIKN